MKRKYLCIVLAFAILISTFPINTQAATIPVFLNLPQKGVVNSNSALIIEWLAPSGNVASYIISVRQLSTNSATTSVLIVDNVTLSSSTTEYTIPWSKLGYGYTYRISVGAVMADGTRVWSEETYFFTSAYKAATNTTVSFQIYNGFATDWKNAIYYSAQAWNKVTSLGYEVVNTYAFSEGHNSTTITKGDGLNRVTNATPATNSTALMATHILRTSTGKIKEADININVRDYKWTVGAKSGYADIQSVMTHEMGHAAGLPHCYESFATGWTMYYSTPLNDTSKRSLEAGDNRLFTSLYWNI